MSRDGPGPAGSVLEFAAAAERTALAWERNGIGLVTVGALLVHESRDRSGAAHVVLGVTVMALGAALSVVLAPARYRRIMADVRAGRAPSPGPLVPLVGAVVVLVALTAGVLLRP